MPPVEHVEQEDAADRRASSRVSFEAVLGVAEYKGRLPTATAFRPVPALDLSHTGVRFNTTSWPTSDSLVLMLGNRRTPTFAVARIVGCDAQVTENGERCFAVRCEFEKWLDSHA